MTLDDISGLDKCAGRGCLPADDTDSAVFRELRRRWPDAAEFLWERRRGERLCVPLRPVSPVEIALGVDDGKMSVRKLSRIAGVSWESAAKARESRG